ncbi:MAG TPA: prephenate dehydrogenase/arogenate dehydrogenase family protein [Candidatus Omnitrophota bacterium]|nr:prephenate dehydrogenase/arogenate dehydrogenase family protein [Candidatus Omnitrophota bacterium]
MRFKKVTIVGIGLIGGSLGLALRKKFPGIEVIGLSRSLQKIARAKKKGLIDWGSRDPRKAFSNADLIVIATPVSLIFQWIREAEKWAKPGTVVTDVGSTKGEIVRRAEREKFRNIRFVGSHPMAGSHESGMEFAEKDLFKGSLVFVAKTRQTDSGALKAMIVFWKKICGKVIVLDPVKHDRIVADISHIPHALASLLVQNVPSRSLPFASSGFLDTTRVAQGDPRLWTDIFRTNKTSILRGLSIYRKALDRFAAGLRSRQEGILYRFLAKSSKIRRDWKSF